MQRVIFPWSPAGDVLLGLDVMAGGALTVVSAGGRMTQGVGRLLQRARSQSEEWTFLAFWVATTSYS